MHRKSQQLPGGPSRDTIPHTPYLRGPRHRAHMSHLAHLVSFLPSFLSSFLTPPKLFSASDLHPVPSHLDAADGGVGEPGEDRLGNIEIAVLASLAAVGHGDDGGRAVEVDLDLAAAERVVVGVAAGRGLVEEQMRERHDRVLLRVVDAAGAEPRCVVGQVARCTTRFKKSVSIPCRRKGFYVVLGISTSNGGVRDRVFGMSYS